MHQVRVGSHDVLGRFPVGGVVVFAASPVVLNPGNVRHAGVQTSNGAGPLACHTAPPRVAGSAVEVTVTQCATMVWSAAAVDGLRQWLRSGGCEDLCECPGLPGKLTGLGRCQVRA